MKPSEGNGHLNGQAEPPPNGSDPPDPLTEAESLKAILTEAASRAGRLVQALKQSRKQNRVLTSAWTALKALNLDPGGRP